MGGLTDYLKSHVYHEAVIAFSKYSMSVKTVPVTIALYSEMKLLNH
jgi:uncharacterized protein (DUF2236 family)